MMAQFKAFEANGERSPALDFLYHATLGVCPTSVELERTFSVGGQFVTKLRTRLGDKLLNNLVFLKQYFASKTKVLCRE